MNDLHFLEENRLIAERDLTIIEAFAVNERLPSNDSTEEAVSIIEQSFEKIRSEGPTSIFKDTLYPTLDGSNLPAQN